MKTFDLTEYPLPNGTVVEASAGTGKTYSVAAHVTLGIAVQEDLRIGEVLITTFTRNAAAELRGRVRARMIATAERLRGSGSPPQDELDTHLLADAAERSARAGRLERAVAEFDTATVATIHGVCSKVLKAAGMAVAEAGDEDLVRRIVAEVVNDELLAEAVAGRTWDETGVTMAVQALLGDPFLVPFFAAPPDDPVHRRLEDARALVERCVAGVRAALAGRPSFDDLLRLAWEVVRDPARAAVRDELRRRFKLAVIDEAQDTSRLQWEFFHELFPPGDDRPLVAVGDPKQAIYGFRGADVQAYLRFAQPRTGSRPRRTLDVNRRSDQPLLDVLNEILPRASFGAGIDYHPVHAPPENAATRLAGLPPVEFLDVAGISLVEAAARKVGEILAVGRLVQPARPATARDICVLVRVNQIGAAIGQRLAAAGIRVVSTGTASVMDSRMALDLRSLVEAMERPSSRGRLRRAAATRFFGHQIRAVAALAEAEELVIQERIVRLGTTLRQRGISACLAELMAEPAIVRQVTAGAEGERDVTDLGHLVELLHDATGGRGVPPTEVLERLAELGHRDEKSDLVSRRIESDEDAVRIMTIHAAKGLEFPFVIVADTWRPRATADRMPVFYADTTRRIDLAGIEPDLEPAAASKAAAIEARRDELGRLLYVALTRAKHHLCVLVPRTDKPDGSLLAPLLASGPTLRPADDLPPLAARPRAAQAATSAGLAPLPAVRQTYERTSFSGIVARWQRRAPGIADDEIAGGDEPSPAPATAEDEPAGIIDLPAGTAVGTAIHEIFEKVDTSCVDRGRSLEEEVCGVVAQVAAAGPLADHRDAVAATVLATLRTPFGGPPGAVFRDVTFADIRPADRLAEMRFEMALPLAGAGLVAADIGRVLAGILPAADPLAGYAAALADSAFEIPLAGLVNGSVDAVLRLPCSTPDEPRLVIADYKSNRLHRRGAADPAAAYAPAGLREAMADSHYILQGLLYGTAVYRMLRWRLRRPDPGACIAGIVYAFIRGTRGPDTPADAAGLRQGMFAWQPPAALWPALSRLFGGSHPEAAA